MAENEAEPEESPPIQEEAQSEPVQNEEEIKEAQQEVIEEEASKESSAKVTFLIEEAPPIETPTESAIEVPTEPVIEAPTEPTVETPTETIKESEPEETISEAQEFIEGEPEEGIEGEITETPEIGELGEAEPPRVYSSEYFLNKHTPSFRCFEQYLCSSSDLKITLYYFPPLTDPGLDDALNYFSPKPEPDPDGTDKYVNMCKYLGIVPIKRVINSMGTDTLDLKYYGLTLKQMRGIADALKVNSNIKYLILQDNWMSPEATGLISEVLRESNSIRVLNLRECRIGEEGAEKLCEGISSTQFLQELDLSFNSLGDKGLQILQQSLCENVSIKKLNISHNKLTEESGVTLEKILLDNKVLEQLDLSWNGFYTRVGNKKLFNGFRRNEFITWLSLAWNGITTPGATLPISRYVRRTKTLQFLDLSWNRLTQKPLNMIKAAIARNKSLDEVKLGYNIYTPDEAQEVANFSMRNETLRRLDMEDMCVKKEFLEVKKNLQRRGKSVEHGHVLSNYEIKGPNIIKLLFERCKYLAMKPKKKKKKKNFGHFVLSLPDKNVTPAEFETHLKKKRVKKIDKDLLQELMSRFATKRSKINTAAMKEAFMELYPDTVLPEEKKKKKKKKKKKGKQKKKKQSKVEEPKAEEIKEEKPEEVTEAPPEPENEK